VTVSDAAVRIHHGALEVAVHGVLNGRRQRAVDPAHYAGVAGAGPRGTANWGAREPLAAEPSSLLRALDEYEALVGGGF
jgi:hypothetical protein